MGKRIAVAWRVQFTNPESSGSNFTKIYDNETEKDKWVHLHQLGGFTVKVTPLYE
jgi:hypothetical protein